MWRRLIYGIVVLAAAGSAAIASADEDEHDHEVAREAVAEGKILPLDQVLTRVRRDFPGELLGVELEDDEDRGSDARLLYEFKLLAKDGAVRELYYDARTGAFVKARGRNLGDLDRDDDEDHDDDEEEDDEDQHDEEEDGGWFNRWFGDD